MGSCRLGVVSDIHYASSAEQVRGEDCEYRELPNPLLRLFVKYYRRYIWLRNPLHQNHLLDSFLNTPSGFDIVVANGDFCADTHCVGVSDEASCESALQCLRKLRDRFGSKLRAVFGDHELGKFSLVGRKGGLRLASWHTARTRLELEPFWRHDLGCYALIGIVSSLVALPAYSQEALPEELPQWHALRREHLEQVRQCFVSLGQSRRILLFCHDPTALPFLLTEGVVGERLSQIEQTVIGHLHSNLILRQSRWLAGMPRLTFMGNTVRRLSSALREARNWRPFNVRLCPSLAGIELLKDGGYLSADLDLTGQRPARFQLHRISR